MYRIDVWMFWNFMRKLIILYLLRIVLFQYWLNIDWKYTIHGYIRVGKLRSCLQGSLSQMWQKERQGRLLGRGGHGDRRWGRRGGLGSILGRVGRVLWFQRRSKSRSPVWRRNGAPFLLFYYVISKLCPTLCDPMDCGSPGSSVDEVSQARILGVGFHFLLQGIFLTQGSNLNLLHWQADSLPLNHQGSPFAWVLLLIEEPLGCNIL